MVDGARGVLNALLADVYIFTDHMSGAAAGLSPGYGLTLVAETTAKNLISAESIADLSDKVGFCRREAHKSVEELKTRQA